MAQVQNRTAVQPVLCRQEDAPREQPRRL